MLLMLAIGAMAAASGAAEDRTVPFWPEEVTNAIHAEIDGLAALRTVRDLGRFHRVHGSPGFAAAAQMMRDRLAAAGLADAAVERFPADGQTRYAHFRSRPARGPPEAAPRDVSPRAPPTARY